MPRFTLRDIFLATTLIGVGMGGVVWMFQNKPNLFIIFVIEYGSAGMIGAGLGTIFHRKRFGAGLAIVALLILQFVEGIYVAANSNL